MYASVLAAFFFFYLAARQDVGYAEPFSAHQLLYPGGEDTRALLLELLSMLPPEGVRCASLSLHRLNVWLRRSCCVVIQPALLTVSVQKRNIRAFPYVVRSRPQCWTCAVVERGLFTVNLIYKAP